MNFGNIFGGGGQQRRPRNQRVTHKSGASRLLDSFIGAFIVAPIVIVVMVFVLGWNEQRAVCEGRMINAGKRDVHEVGCDDPAADNHELIMSTCDISKNGLEGHSPGGDFAGLENVGTGMRIQAEMYQCIETKTEETKKDNVGGGETTVTTYYYSLDWSDEQIDSSYFSAKDSDEWYYNCGVENPSFPLEMPATGTWYAPAMQIGAFNTSMTSKVPLDTPITDWKAPSAWSTSGSLYASSQWEVASNGIGSVRVGFYTTDWSSPTATFLGENLDGTIVGWKAPGSWLCVGGFLKDLRMGTYSKDQLFATLHAESSFITVVLRIVGWLFLWVSFTLCFKPCEVMADCIPFCGKYLGDAIECVACCLSCIPATACCLCVCGIVWAAMRPLVGIPILLVALALFGTMIYFSMQKDDDESGEDSPLDQEEKQDYGTSEDPPPKFDPQTGERIKPKQKAKAKPKFDPDTGERLR